MSAFVLPKPITATIAGAAYPTRATFDVVNPATGEVFATAPDASAADVDAAVRAAHDAFAAWRSDPAARRAALHAAADALDAARDEIAPILTAEQGKPLTESAREVAIAAAYLRYYADMQLERQVIRDDAQALVEIAHRPLGAVAIITPWNFPLIIGTAKIAPALSAGNTVVLKPSPFTPLSSLKLGEVLRGVLPPGVLNVLSGGNEAGAAMTEHPLIRKISFTGSTATGKAIAAAAAADLKRTTLELGGNDAAIVLDDADPATVAAGIFPRAFSNTGQVCVAPKRVYVPESLRAPVVEAFAALARNARVGDGADPATQYGPLNNRPQRDRVASLVRDAVSRGATIAAGGSEIAGNGYFYQPTILTDISDGTPIVDEEQFGPALPIIGYRDVEDALTRANATHFGLGGSVWSGDPERATAVAERMEAGMTWVNTHTATSFDQPFAGIKWSGIGVENGRWALEGFTEMHVIHRAR
ncbi:aldehyde dehydrogenase family protein [Micromonospora musae]|uniref:Aldehyde dehydrogenase family protein n=1 Tax=Micromonospora musae TaxID=1894970 RepID=A0A3A9YMB7_9ACTN|nr:aldehyde dehydrogenase family protein [Micromonospora musae]RKN35566.1 aldehyde dehydrogenase family protein [Micromonospora musae]